VGRHLQLFDFLLLPLKTNSIKRKKAMGCKWRRERKITDGLAWGESRQQKGRFRADWYVGITFNFFFYLK